MARTVRQAIMPIGLVREARAILQKYNIRYAEGNFQVDKPNPQYTWDWHFNHRFFTGPQRLRGCCAVIEMFMCYEPPPRDRFPVDITPEEWITVFKWHVRDILKRQNRRMALVTLDNTQRSFVPFLEAAGFTIVSTGYNPGTRHTVTIWVLNLSI